MRHHLVKVTYELEHFVSDINCTILSICKKVLICIYYSAIRLWYKSHVDKQLCISLHQRLTSPAAANLVNYLSSIKTSCVGKSTSWYFLVYYTLYIVYYTIR